MFYAYNGATPRLGKGVFVAEGAVVVGDVQVGDHSSIWFNSVVRGDVYPIRIGSRTNIQDNSVLHVTGGRWSLEVGDEVTVGHRVVLHGCTVCDKVLIGIGAVVLDGARIGSGSIVGAGSVVPPGFEVPEGTLVMGVPAKVRREVTPEELEAIVRSAENYVTHAARYMSGDVRMVDSV